MVASDSGLKRSDRNHNNENDPPIMDRLEPSSHVVNKVNAILFKSDQGPVSNLLQETNVNEEDDAFPPPTDEIQFPCSKMPDGISPQRFGVSPQRSIHFDSSLATSYVLDEEIVQLRHTAAIVANLQTKLKEAKQQAAEERTQRKRKEKNLIKLAKEMNHRNQEQSKVDKKMEEMEETIADLEERLNSKRQELPRLQALCEQKEVSLNQVQATSERHLAELEQAKREARLAREELLQVIGNTQKNVEPTVSESRIPEPKQPSSSSALRGVAVSVQQVAFYAILITMASIAFLRSGLVHPDVMNILCAPIPPGSYIPAADNNTNLFIAPYWAPAVYRRELFAMVCPGRGHTVLRQVRWKLEVLRDGVRVWKGRAGGGFRVEDDAIVMLGRRHHQIIDQVNGPWTLT